MSNQPPKKRMKSLFSFYKKDKNIRTLESNFPLPSNPPDSLHTSDMEIKDDVSNEPSIQTDPGLRAPVYSFSVNKQHRIRREYLQLGPCQPKLQNYPPTFDGRDNRHFQHRWFTLFPWLEYSVAKDRVFCFPCFLFEKNPPKSPLFTTTGCCNWSRMIAWKKGVCEQHVGKINSFHRKNVQDWANLLKTPQHIDRVIDKLPSEVVRQNRLRLKTTIAAVKYLGKQGLPFRGHDESSDE
ncbi:uncharacterized protein LOC141673981 [Apium graveolens]|uniref:uncharacterized protein LOC141673981 n=1 Tax=Apium graveolens TaxID=4045 RepID=UPI003D7B667D